MAAPPDRSAGARLPVLAAASPPAIRSRVDPTSSPQPTRGRYLVETWGCQMNTYDSERFAGQLQALGFLPARDEGEADLILLNTCSIREQSEEKLFSRLGRLRPLKQERPELVIGVAGCVAQQQHEAILRRSDLVSFVIGTGAVAELPRLVSEAKLGNRPIDVAMRDDRFDEVRPIARTSGVRAYVTVVEGCDKSCSFCIVPLTRGPELNRAPAAILAEVEAAIAAGAREIELLGQNVNAYRHGDVDFSALLRLVNATPGVERLRFTTSHPREFTEELMRTIAACDRVCKHVHLPVQSGSSSVLRRMARGYDQERYLSRISRLRELVPDVGLSTDIIVGFPQETEAEFQETLHLIQDVRFDQVFAFAYSARPATRAFDLADSLTREAKLERLRRLFAIQDEISLERNRRFEEREVEVLVEGPSRRPEAHLSGRTGDNRIVNFPAADIRVGATVRVRIERAYPHSLFGIALPAGPPSALTATSLTQEVYG